MTLTSASDTKEFDGTPLTNGTVTVGGDGFVDGEGATYNVTGSQKIAGSSANEFTYELNEGTNAANYDITKTEGTLTVTDRAAKYEITVVANSKTETYDGTEKSVSGFETLEFTVNGQKYTVEGLSASASGTDAGEYTANVTGTAVVKDADKNDVTKQFTVETVDGKLTITKASLTITADSATKVYDEQPLTWNHYTNTELVVGDTLESVTITGSQTLVGTTANVASNAKIVRKNTGSTEAVDVTGNYDITYEDGVLEVTDGTTEQEVDRNLVVTKTHDDKEYNLGETVTFTITVKNIYDKPKTIIITEIPGVTITGDSTFENVAAGATVTTTATYKITSADILAGEFTNTVTVEFVGEQKYENTDVVDPAPVDTTLEVIKTSDVGENETVGLGETITYTITVTNNGNVPFYNVKVVDEMTGLKETIDVLEAGKTETFTTTYTVTSDDILKGTILNRATAEGDPVKDPDDPETPKTPEDKDTEEVEPDNLDTTIEVVKTTTSKPAYGETYTLGETIAYQITVKNVGNVPYKNVVVKDDLTGDTWSIPELAVGQTETFNTEYTVTEEDIIAEKVLNVATAAGDRIEDPKDPENPKTPEGEGKKEDKTDPPTPSFELTKEITNSDGKPFGFNEEIRYKVTFTNTGNVSLTNTVIDDVAGASGTAKHFDLGKVGVGESVTLEYAYTVQDGDLRPVYEADGVTAAKHIVTNTATVTTVPASAKEGDRPMTGTAFAEHEVAQWYHAIFVDTRTNEVVRFINVPYGGSIELPDAPEHRGYTFLGWRYPILDNITFNQVVYAYYERDAETIYDARIPLAGGYISNVGDTFD